MDIRSIVEEPETNRFHGRRRVHWLSIICFILFVVFLILTIAFYNSSVVKLDKNTSQIMGVEYVANIQATVYATGCGIISAIFLVGGFITLYISDIGKR